MEVLMWCDVCKYALADVAFILCSDFKQFSAVCEHWAGCSVPEGSLERSHMIQDLARGNRLKLTENQRSDHVLFDFYTSLSARRITDALREARIRFPKTSRVATTIVTSHARRYINMQRNLKEKPQDAIFSKAHVNGKVGGTSPQSLWMWPGLRIIGAGGAVKKCVFETVEGSHSWANIPSITESWHHQLHYARGVTWIRPKLAQP